MKRIGYFIYSLGNERSVNSDGQQTVNANGIVSTFIQEFIPGTFSFSIMFSILGLEVKQHTLRIMFKNPDGEILVDTNDALVQLEQLIAADPNAKLIPPEEKGISMGLDLKNVIFKKNGYYFTEVYCDGEKLGEYRIYAAGRNTDN